MDQPYEYDVFISHSSIDKPKARELAERFKADGLNVWLDEWKIEPGDLISLKIEQGLEQSRVLVFLMSAHAFASDWVTLERHTALFRDPTNFSRRFIPLRLDDSPVKDVLKQFSYIDWRQQSDQEYARLLMACRPILENSRDIQMEELSSNYILKGHSSLVYGLAITPDGRWAVSSSNDWTVRLWDLHSNRCVSLLKGHTGDVSDVSISSDGRLAVSASYDTTARVWDLHQGRSIASLRGHTDRVIGIALTADGQTAVSTSLDGTVRVWDTKSGVARVITKLLADKVIVSPDGLRVLTCSGHAISVLEIDTLRPVANLRGHNGNVHSIAVAANGRLLVSGSADRTIRLWDVMTWKCLATLEGHTAPITGVAIDGNAQLVVSSSLDETVRVWDLVSFRSLGTLRGHYNVVTAVAVTPDGKVAVSASKDSTLRLWDLTAYFHTISQDAQLTRYTNAKVLLVGDSGVGKTGLALRLTEDRFQPTISTDAAWATQMRVPHHNTLEDIDKEIWLWDFAGQADYRLIHQLYMDETALVVLVFNPQSDNPFDGLGQWDRDIERAARRPFRKLLVAGRCDRGGLTISQKSIEDFRTARGYEQYVETSAYTGQGCIELRDAIVDNIVWEDIPWTASPRIFKLLKQEIVGLKDEGIELLRMVELRQQLEMRLPGDHFTIQQLQAVVELLASSGVVWPLDFGDFVLLQPERINAYAAAVVRTVRAHTDEIGCILEESVLAGDLNYYGMNRLTSYDEQIILRAMHHKLVTRGFCLREPTEAGTLLVFPSYFKRERPELEDHPAAFVTYRFNGQLDEIYATLVVRLHHTLAFEKDQLWRYAADFKTQAGKRVGLKMTKKGEGSAEITIYFEPGIPDDTKVTFIRYVHEHLRSRDPSVTRIRHYVCPNPNCGEPIEGNRAVQNALRMGFEDIPCQFCRKAIPLVDLIEEKFASEHFQRRVQRLRTTGQHKH